MNEFGPQESTSDSLANPFDGLGEGGLSAILEQAYEVDVGNYPGRDVKMRLSFEEAIGLELARTIYDETKDQYALEILIEMIDYLRFRERLCFWNRHGSLDYLNKIDPRRNES